MPQENKKKQKSGKFLFLAHWVENWNWLLWIVKDLHNNPHHAWRWAWLWPVCAIASVIYALGNRAYNVVDRFKFNGGQKGETWLIRNFGWHFMVAGLRKRIYKRILATVREAQRQGFDVIGLGALIKAEWLTAGGKRIVDDLGDDLHTPIVHGDTMTASAVILRVLSLVSLHEIRDRPIFIIGATSKIGRAVALMLAIRGIKVKMFTTSKERYDAIHKEAIKYNCAANLCQATLLSEGKDCPVWITGKAKFTGKRLLKHIPFKAIVVNFSVPDPLSRSVLRTRPDVLHVDGGLIGYDPQRTTLRFTMRLKNGLTYACHAGTIVHAHEKWTHHEVGQVDLKALVLTWRAACDLGFCMPKMTSHLRPIRQKNESLSPSAPDAFSGVVLELEVAA